MIPKIILHNSISLDGSLINFDVDMETHYKIAGSFKPDTENPHNPAFEVLYFSIEAEMV